MLLPSEASFFFFSSSHQAPHPFDLSHQPSSLIKLSSPLNTKAKAVAIAIAVASRRRRVPRRHQPQPQLYY